MNLDGGTGPALACAGDAALPERPRAVTVLVCSSCRDVSGSDARPRAGERFAYAVRAVNDDADIAVRGVECLGNCKRRLSAALLMDGAWSYVFGDLSIENATDLVTAARLFRSSEDGLLPWRGRPDSLKRGLVARIPPLSLTHPAGERAAPSEAEE